MPIVDESVLADMIADGRIAALTVDTNIFDEKGLQFKSASLQAIISLKSRHFAFILSETVAKEVRRHLRTKTEEALTAAGKGIEKALKEFETEQPTLADLLTQISRGLTASDVADGRLNAYLMATECHVLNDTRQVLTETIYSAYFEARPPFGSGGKKNEFPDALALNALELEAANQKIGILVISKDKDWSAFCEKSDRLYYMSELDRALDLIASAPVNIRDAVITWLAEEDVGRHDVLVHLSNITGRVAFFVDAHASTGEVEVFQWDAELVDVNWPVEKKIDIIKVELSDDRKSGSVTVSLPLELQIQIPVELNFSVWDGIDRESINLNSRTIEIDDTLYVRATLSLSLYALGTEGANIELLSVDLDKDAHVIELGDVEIFEDEG